MTQTSLLTFFVIVFSGFSIYQYRHLPMIDFRGWKNGADLAPGNQPKPEVYLTYKNKVTGETKEYLSPDYPWNDSVWTSQWEFVTQRVDESSLDKGAHLMISDQEGNDVTAAIIENPGYQFILASYSLEDASEKGLQKASDLSRSLIPEGVSFVVVTGSLVETIDKFRNRYNPGLEYYNADDTELKTMIRANPGLMLLRDGIVVDKWHWRDIPDYEKLKKKYPDL
jgi:hypothetical protein